MTDKKRKLVYKDNATGKKELYQILDTLVAGNIDDEGIIRCLCDTYVSRDLFTVIGLAQEYIY